MSKPFRPCQQIALDIVAERHKAGEKVTNLSLCTGAGKTRIIQNIHTYTSPK
jgi:type I site-specific restriction endonuclease